MNNINHVSLYTQGGQQAACMYYRFYQYISKLDINTLYNKQIPDCLYDKVMPLAYKPLMVKVCIMLLILVRVTSHLLYDYFNTPQVLVISRTLLNRWFPFFFITMLEKIKNNGATIIWDFDDNITTGEISKKNFTHLSKIADKIILASPYLKELIGKEYQCKIFLLPTTDGSIVDKYTQKFDEVRVSNYISSINLIWVGTASGLQGLRVILPLIDKAAEILRSQGKIVSLSVVSNGIIDYKPNFFFLKNIKWTREIATETFLAGHIGLMPLHDNVFEGGKGGFKLIQYLSVGLPSLASAVGINKDILANGGGVAIGSLESELWVNEIVKMGTNLEYWKKISDEAIENYKKNYNYERNLKAWRELLNT